MNEIILKDLPKISLNQWYAGSHWSKRNEIKNNYHYLIQSQLKSNYQFTKEQKYEVNYVFFFKTKPLDASNCVAMVKLIEDVLFEDDNYKIIQNISIQSNKGKEDLVYIQIKTC